MGASLWLANQTKRKLEARATLILPAIYCRRTEKTRAYLASSLRDQIMSAGFQNRQVAQLSKLWLSSDREFENLWPSIELKLDSAPEASFGCDTRVCRGPESQS
jgi:hypothetical protein